MCRLRLAEPASRAETVAYAAAPAAEPPALRLRRRAQAGGPVDSVAERSRFALSVADHLVRLLNSRPRRALRAAPDHASPEQLRTAIAQTILRHEPRISAVHVR